MVRSLKFRIYEEREFYYSYSENKGADQLYSYCTADLRLCFRIGKNLVFHREAQLIMLLWCFLGRRGVGAERGDNERENESSSDTE